MNSDQADDQQTWTTVTAELVARTMRKKALLGSIVKHVEGHDVPDRSDLIHLHRPPTTIRHPDDIARLRSILNAAGYDADDEAIAWAWRDYSQSQWAAGWAGLNCASDDSVLGAMVERLTDDAAHAGQPAPQGDDLAEARAEIDRLRDLVPTRTIAPGEPCQFESCDQPATVVAHGHGYYDDDGKPTLARDPFDEPDDPYPSPLRHPGLGVYCVDHAGGVAREGGADYTPECPNCRCRFGVG